MTAQDWFYVGILVFNILYSVVKDMRAHKLTKKSVEKAFYNNRQYLAQILEDIMAKSGKDSSMIHMPPPASTSSQVKP